MGMPIKGTDKFGDLHSKAVVTLPKTLTES
jgi:hypothetical protein